MILRDAIVSSERRRVGRVKTVRVDSRPEPLRPSLTVSDVCAWLMEEGEVARRTLASQLAPELETLRAAARAEGYADGHTAAMRQVGERHAAALERLAAIVQAAEVASERATDELTNICSAVVAEAFAKLAGELLATPEATLGAVRNVLGRVREGRRYTVYVHPSALAALEAERADLQAAIGDAALDVQGDAGLSSGGCRVECDLGTINAAFDVQLERLIEMLRGAHAQDRVVQGGAHGMQRSGALCTPKTWCSGERRPASSRPRACRRIH